MRPLYRELAEAKLNRDHGNAGLWYDKYCNQWCSDPEKTELARWSLEAFKDENPKLTWIKTLTGKTIGEQRLLDEATARHSAVLLAHEQSPLFFETEWHFVTGLGREHPVENGFAWHHSLGVPYLPGSSIKGMVRAWAEYWLDGEVDGDDVRRIFGLPPLSWTVRIGCSVSV
ncbi:MAG: RAMP superfamily CRISPR-associated protein [Acidobacteria bacterium]|nr:RAMP superfamily CRISPR-associated protein [Acidobacteriota bacterium]